MNRLTNNSQHTRGFTLVELMVAIFIVTILASFILLALNDVRERARERRAETQVRRIHELLMQRLDEYRTRSVPVNTVGNANTRAIAEQRLLVLRDLMRMEIPDRKTDVTDPPVNAAYSGLNGRPPALQRAYQRRAMRSTTATSIADLRTENDWTSQHQGSECLYMVLSAIQEGDSNGIEFFKQSEIGDTDGDGMLEILDPWGKPIEFLRWAPGVNSPIQVQDRDEAADPFDLVKRDRRWGAATPEPFALYPFVVSGGPDETIGLVLDDPDAGEYLHYSNTFYGGNAYPNDPYTEISAAGTPVKLGQIFPIGNNFWGDNIHNHAAEDN